VQRGRERIYPSYFQMAKVELEEEFSEVRIAQVQHL
jgi:hypothetical protein